ncbi:hypothetical protein Leryth_011560, partial [Lithospermum erythrorhizon]
PKKSRLSYLKVVGRVLKCPISVTGLSPEPKFGIEVGPILYKALLGDHAEGQGMDYTVPDRAALAVVSCAAKSTPVTLSAI